MSKFNCRQNTHTQTIFYYYYDLYYRLIDKFIFKKKIDTDTLKQMNIKWKSIKAMIKHLNGEIKTKTTTTIKLSWLLWFRRMNNRLKYVYVYLKYSNSTTIIRPNPICPINFQWIKKKVINCTKWTNALKKKTTTTKMALSSVFISVFLWTIFRLIFHN